MTDMPVLLIALVAVLVLFVVGWIIVGLVFKLLWWAIIGLVIGALARAILPGKQAIGILATAGIGIAASILGGVIGHIAGIGGFGQFVIAVLVAAAGVFAFNARRVARA
jgi:uncharacterized membrane protein YeaQ/YmgE (transglycosylase-associated protein family)